MKGKTMSTTKRQLSAVTILKEFFGLKEGQTNMDFLQEIKQLSAEERQELALAACEQLGAELTVKV